MMKNPNQNPPSECGNCGRQQPWVLHHIHNLRLRQNIRSVCTSCVLKLHFGSFCPICFEVYEDSLQPSHRTVCNRCPSMIHTSCITKESSSSSPSMGPSSPSASAASYVCPPCLNPNFEFFDLKKGGRIDMKMAEVLLAAAKISASSMHNAVRIARLEEEKRVKELAVAYKRAKEAVENEWIIRISKIRLAMGQGQGSNSVKKSVGSNAVAVVPPQNRNNSQSSLLKNEMSGGVEVEWRSVNGQLTIAKNGKSGGGVDWRNGGVREKRLTGFQMQNVEDRDKSGKFNTSDIGRRLHQDLILAKKDNYLSHVERNQVGDVERNRFSSFGPSAVGPVRNLHGSNVTRNPGRLQGCRDTEISPPVSGLSQDEAVTNSNEVALAGSSNTSS